MRREQPSDEQLVALLAEGGWPTHHFSSTLRTLRAPFIASLFHAMSGSTANVTFVDRLDQKSVTKAVGMPQQSATPAHPEEEGLSNMPSYLTDLFGGGDWNRTNDLRVMSPSL